MRNGITVYYVTLYAFCIMSRIRVKFNERSECDIINSNSRREQIMMSSNVHRMVQTGRRALPPRGIFRLALKKRERERVRIAHKENILITFFFNWNFFTRAPSTLIRKSAPDTLNNARALAQSSSLHYDCPRAKLLPRPGSLYIQHISLFFFFFFLMRETFAPRLFTGFLSVNSRSSKNGFFCCHNGGTSSRTGRPRRTRAPMRDYTSLPNIVNDDR